MTKLKRQLSILLIITMILPILPIGQLTVHAYDEDKYTITEVILYKIYDKNRQPIGRRLTINGKYLKDADVSMVTNTGDIVLTNRERNTETTLQFILANDQVGSKIKVGSTEINLNEGSMPTLTQVSPEVKSGYDGQLTLKGTNFSSIDGENITAKIYKEGATQDISSDFSSGNEEANIFNITLALGLQDIVFEKNTTETKTFNTANQDVPVKVKVTYTYKEQFLLYQEINVANLQMTPNRGSKGDTLFLEAPVTGTTVDLREYDVFFLKAIDGTDTYKVTNKGKNRKFQSKVIKEGKEFNILTVEIPDIPVGDYFVVLTNIADSTDPAKQITQRKVLEQKFTVIDGTKKPFIQSVLPASGPDTGSNTTISGKFLGTMNIDEFNLDNLNQKPVVTTTEANPKTLTISYGPGTYGANKEPITSAIREIKVIIGGEATFLKKGTEWDIELNSALDKIKVRTAQITIGDTNPIKDVVVETTTTFTKSNGDKIVIRERAERKSSYKYILSTIQPEIISITPEKIEVSPKGLEYEIPEDRMFAIYGKNFMLHKYRDDEGKEIYRYPRIQIGDIVIDKNENPDLYVRLFNDKGAELDGTENNEIGTKILLKLPKGARVSKATKETLTVQNPMRNSMVLGLSDIKPDFVEFVVPEAGTIPVINTVKPDTVSVDGGETVTITGNSFQGDVQVIIDGQVVKGIKRKEDGTEITFPAPKGREGETQIQVMNPSGGMDTRPFFYVKTFTNPKIIDFNPKRGNSGTIVMLKGENFLRPDPMGTEENIFRLIGTRVFLDDLELNEYNRNPVNNRITLVPFEPNKNLLTIVDRRVEVEAYYQGILLKDSNDKKYIITVNTKGEIKLTDGGLNNYDIKIDPNDEAKIVANKQGGLVYKISVDENSITLTAPDGAITKLTYITPYKTNGSEIVGQKVKVIDGQTIYFTVPIMNNQAEGYKDLTIINPDTKKDQKIGNQGFYFIKQPERRPKITDIIPNEGSVSGGYAIEILGENFETNTATKPKVYINAVEVPVGDTTVNIEGTRITIIVPKYVGDLKKDKNTDKWPVPVVVLNPDGGTANEEKGFYYVIPSSSPQITKISPVKGSAAGGEVVEIWGKDFRYFEPYDDLNGNLEYDEDIGETFNDLYKNEKWDDLRNRNIDKWDEIAGKTKFTPTHPRFEHYYNSAVLPKIYFGNKEAQIVEFEIGYIKVLAPPNLPGKVDVFILNNDGGISEKTPYTYETAKVTISSVVPDQGRKEGGDKVEVHGTGFAPSTIEVYGQSNPVNMPIVRLGNITNRNIDREKDNSGRIDNQKTTVQLAGGLKVEYNGHQKTLTLTINEGGIDYKYTITNYDNKEKYIPIELLKSGNTIYSGKELVKVSIEDGRLLVDRGFAPKTTFVNNTHVTIETPSYYTVGKTPIFIINPDGGSGSGNFEYKNPDSKPVITNITRDSRQPIEEFRKEINGKAKILKVNYKGGSIVTVEGTDFRDNAIVKLSNLLTIGEDALEYNLTTKLTFTMPPVPESQVGRLLPVVVQNKDGGSALSDKLNPPIFIEITKGESDPETNTIEPSKGSAIGGTKVVITGNDFRETMKGYEGEKLRVFFGEIEAKEIRSISYNRIELIAPSSNRLGKVPVKVENPDGTMTAGNVTFEYISKPTIQTMSPNKLFTNDTKTEVTITGNMFQQGAKVVVGGKIAEKKDIKEDMAIKGEGIIGVDTNGSNREVAVVGGIEGATVKVENDKTIKVTFPETKDLENSSIIIINPDGGISNPYDGFRYEKPVPTKPLVLEGIPGYESTVQLIWSKSDENILNKATAYEIYGRKTKDKENTFIGSTKDAEFLVKSLEPETQYTFMVRALNEYGAAIDFATVTVKTLDLRQDEKLKEKEEKRKAEENKIKANGKEEIKDGRLNITLGTNKFTGGVGSLDLSLAKYKNQDKITIAIPIELARKDNRLTIKDGTMTTIINARDLYTLSVSKLDKGNDDAYIRIHIDKTTGDHLPRGKKAASKAYEISFDYIYDKDSIDIQQLLRSGKLFLEQDTIVYPNTKNTSIYKINEETGNYEKLNSTTVDIKDRSKLILLSDR